MYVYAYPLVLMDVTRQVAMAEGADQHVRHEAHAFRCFGDDVLNPDTDMLPSTAWLDLSKEPIVLSEPTRMAGIT